MKLITYRGLLITFTRRAKSHETLIHKLINENSELRTRVEEMASSTKEIIKSTTEIKSILLNKTNAANKPCFQSRPIIKSERERRGKREGWLK